MFTGIVEHRGEVTNVAHGTQGSRIEIGAGPLVGIAVGDSISVNGVCLTAVEVAGATVSLDVVPETLACSNLGRLARGDPINIERAMPANGRFDGHVVQGHVDGVGTVVSTVAEGEGTRLAIEVPGELLGYLVAKGSITVDGVSLTVAGLSEACVEVALIPHTLSETTLGLRQEGDIVNLEVDVLAKYVERLLSR